MKKLFLAALVAALAMPQGVDADTVIAGWDTFDSSSSATATATALGATATFAATGSNTLGTGEGTSRGSSSDGTWGTFAGPVAASTAAGTGNDQNWTAFNGATTAEITFTINNGGSEPLSLSALHFDALAFRPRAPRAYALNVLPGSDLTVGNVFTSAADVIPTFGGLPPDMDSHSDVDLDLTGLADNVLEVGETAILQLAFSGTGTNSQGGHHLWVDNIALSGAISVIPEPSSLALLGLSGMALAFRRRK